MEPDLPARMLRPVDHWQRTRRLTLSLLAAWFLLTFCAIFFARELSGITVFGWPFSFYMTAQGIILVYVFIVGIYAWQMRVLDRRVKDRD